MYNEKRWRMWLMIIPFWVMNILGGYSLFSMYNLFNLNNNCFYFELNNNYEDEQDSTFANFMNSGDIEQTSCGKRSNTHCLKNVFKGYKRQKKIFSADIIVCDNRIDRINTKYCEYLCGVNMSVEDNSFVSVV